MAGRPEETPKRTDFAAIAARFETYAADLRARQCAEVERPAAAPEPEPLEASWNRQFAVQAIGGGARPGHRSAAMAPVAHAVAPAPDFSQLRPRFLEKAVLARPAAGGFAAAEPVVPASGQMDLRRLAKDEPPRRSWLARLFRSA